VVVIVLVAAVTSPLGLMLRWLIPTPSVIYIYIIIDRINTVQLTGNEPTLSHMLHYSSVAL
jgi:hypothetical protein